MASYRTKCAQDAARFVSALVERGYRLDEGWPGKAGATHKNTCRVTHHHRFYWVAYYEPDELKARTGTPKEAPKAPRGTYALCTHPGCHRRHQAHGLCKKHVQRWYYHHNPDTRARKLAKMAAKRRERIERERMAKRKEAA